jgi:hypothetical protein
MNKMIFVAAFVVSSFVGSVQSVAATIITTIRANAAGAFSTLTDNIGVFGPAGASYSNLHFQFTSTFSPKTGFYHTFPDGDAIVGGGFGTMTVNGVDHRFSGADFGNTGIDVESRSLSTRDLDLDLSARRPTDSFSLDISGPAASSPIPQSIFDPASISCAAGITCTGSIDIETDAGLATLGNFTLSNFSMVTSVTVTPIPGALPLFISALGGLGFVGWRHRKMAV